MLASAASEASKLQSIAASRASTIRVISRFVKLKRRSSVSAIRRFLSYRVRPANPCPSARVGVKRSDATYSCIALAVRLDVASAAGGGKAPFSVVMHVGLALWRLLDYQCITDTMGVCPCSV